MLVVRDVGDAEDGREDRDQGTVAVHGVDGDAIEESASTGKALLGVVTWRGLRR